MFLYARFVHVVVHVMSHLQAIKFMIHGCKSIVVLIITMILVVNMILGLSNNRQV